MKLPAAVIAEIERQFTEYGKDERQIRVWCADDDAVSLGWSVGTYAPDSEGGKDWRAIVIVSI